MTAAVTGETRCKLPALFPPTNDWKHEKARTQEKMRTRPRAARPSRGTKMRGPSGNTTDTLSVCVQKKEQPLRSWCPHDFLRCRPQTCPYSVPAAAGSSRRLSRRRRGYSGHGAAPRNRSAGAAVVSALQLQQPSLDSPVYALGSLSPDMTRRACALK